MILTANVKPRGSLALIIGMLKFYFTLFSRKLAHKYTKPSPRDGGIQVYFSTDCFRLWSTNQLYYLPFLQFQSVCTSVLESCHPLVGTPLRFPSGNQLSSCSPDYSRVFEICEMWQINRLMLCATWRAAKVCLPIQCVYSPPLSLSPTRRSRIWRLKSA